MIISKDKVVSLSYELRNGSEKGNVVETIDEKKPLVFLYGTGNLLPEFESNLSGLQVGDTFEFLLKSEDAYGVASEDAIVDVPKSAFEVEGKIDEDILKMGNVIPMLDNKGNRLNGVVREINGDFVTMDFNHPMAGKDLFFRGNVLEVRDATQEELQHGHIHAGCGCGGSCSTSEEACDGNCEPESCTDPNCGCK